MDREPVGELRFDPLTREWVNVVGHRQDRPNLPVDECPFCVGGLEAPEPYEVRWFENRWPAYLPGAPLDPAAAEAAGLTALPAVGACEMVLFSPDHDQSLAGLGGPGVRRVVDLWAQRSEALLARPEVAYVLVFENRGREVGATIDHPHGQVYGFPFVPPAPAREAEVARGHGCPLCVEVRAETAVGAGPAGDTADVNDGAVETRSRLVHDGGEWAAWVPFAATYPYGLRVAPRSHVGRLADLDGPGRDGLAAALVDVLGRYDRLWASRAGASAVFPYMLWVHQAPADRGEREHHLHLHLAPPQRAPGVPRYVASGELGGGLFSNPVVPEDAAAALRSAGDA